MERPQAEMVKNLAFIKRAPEEIFKDDFWTISETLCLYALLLQNNQKYSEYEEYYRLLYSLVVHGIERHEIKPVKSIYKKTNPIISAFLDTTSLVVETCEPINIYTLSIDRNFIKIKPSVLKKCVGSADIIAFFKKYGISLQEGCSDLPTISQLRSQVTGLTDTTSNNSCTQIEHASLRDHIVGGIELPIIDKNEVIKQSRSEAGKKNGEKWRIFVSTIIKPAVEHELKQNCLCLHRDMANRLRENLMNEAKTNFEPKKFNTLKADLPDKIEDGIKKAFYEFDKKYDNVRSRVFRGKYYDSEYDHVPCSLHSGK